MSLGRVGVTIGREGFPRVSGDEPLLFWGNPAWHVFSPRERG